MKDFKLLALLRGTLGRLGAGGLALASCAWLAGGKFTGYVDWEPTIAFLAAFIAWLASCLPEEQRQSESTPAVISEHDRALFRAFVATFPSQERDFLKSQDFGGAFEWRALKGLDELANTWKGPEYEFDNQQAREDLQELIDRIRVFRSLLAQKTFVQGTSGFSRIHWNESYSEESEARSRRTQQVLNEAADQVVETAESFIRRYRPIFGLGDG